MSVVDWDGVGPKASAGVVNYNFKTKLSPAARHLAVKRGRGSHYDYAGSTVNCGIRLQAVFGETVVNVVLSEPLNVGLVH